MPHQNKSYDLQFIQKKVIIQTFKFRKFYETQAYLRKYKYIPTEEGIFTTWTAVVEFLKWINENKK